MSERVLKDGLPVIPIDDVEIGEIVPMMDPSQIQIDGDVLKAELGQLALDRLVARSQVKMAAEQLRAQQARISELENRGPDNHPDDHEIGIPEMVLNGQT